MKTYQLHMLGGFLVGCFIGLKVLGILAALITLRYIIVVVGKATGIGGGSAEAK